MKIVALKNFDNEDEIIEIINNIYTEDKLIINVHCNGGFSYLCDLLTREVNKNKEKIKLYGSQLLSNGFWFFYNTECEKEILNDSLIMIHPLDSEWDVLRSEKVGYTEKLKHDVEKDKLVLKNILTKKELKIYDKGNNVYIHDLDRIKKIFKKI